MFLKSNFVLEKSGKPQLDFCTNSECKRNLANDIKLVLGLRSGLGLEIELVPVGRRGIS